ncbi:AraC-like DNA-binding protein [Filimonas zeae]|uniref:AraC family transcriptional regulator n=1 Tax=Filimonas zeae TaxID=1737353 RepID=A0A917IWQ8_9BACT|nr:response regulator transcription factor [Filimonas zeae]MDR6338849.1 AraC-like DNA-binding protein [Filimonas zeae]GGH66305.1 AraC family transcriptional regulator [Filimonas zeae]
MKKHLPNPIHISHISELHRMNTVPLPEHPLVSVVHFNDIAQSPADFSGGLIMDFYMIAIKKDFSGKIRYGQNYYDFDEGVLSFIAPGQVCYEDTSDRPRGGCMLMFHRDFIKGFPLAKTIGGYSFFSYEVNEALYLSAKEEAMIESIFRNIEQEYRLPIDHFSQQVIISHIELLLTYANRYYNRQFITRKLANTDLLTKLEALLDNHFAAPEVNGLPTVKEVAAQLNVSPDYLSDMLRSHTGQNTQQHIHNRLIEKAKEILSTSRLSVAEVAYQLGFEHPQSFHKLFKKKTNYSPLEYRQLFQ